jgi:hypothetical protein
MRDHRGQGGADRPPGGDGAVVCPRCTRRRLRRRHVCAAAVLVVVVAGVVTAVVSRAGSGTGAGTWFTPGHPQLQVSVAPGCRASVAGYADVVNTFAGPPLVPARPSAGLICQYGQELGSGLPSSADLVLSTSLDRSQAQQLAAVIRRIDLAASSGTVSCPAEFVGAVTLIGVSYPGRADVGLWFATSGCQTLDNGRIGAWEEGNPSFYQAFETAIDRLSPPATTTIG